MKKHYLLAALCFLAAAGACLKQPGHKLGDPSSIWSLGGGSNPSTIANYAGPVIVPSIVVQDGGSFGPIGTSSAVIDAGFLGTLTVNSTEALVSGGTLTGDGGIALVGAGSTISSQALISSTGDVTGLHIGPTAGSPGPTVSYIAIATNGNPFDGGITLATGSTDYAGTVTAVTNSCTSCIVANQPVIVLTPGTAPGTGFRCTWRPSSSLAAATAASSVMYTEFDGGGTQLWFSAATTSTAGNWSWDYVCAGI